MNVLLSCLHSITSNEIKNRWHRKHPIPRCVTQKVNFLWPEGATAGVRITRQDTVGFAFRKDRADNVFVIHNMKRVTEGPTGCRVAIKSPEAFAVYVCRNWAVSVHHAQDAIGYSQSTRMLWCRLDLFLGIAGLAVTGPCLAVRYVAACNYQSCWLIGTWVVISARVNWSAVRRSTWEQESVSLRLWCHQRTICVSHISVGGRRAMFSSSMECGLGQ
jgi:hypothetical protein